MSSSTFASSRGGSPLLEVAEIRAVEQLNFDTVGITNDPDATDPGACRFGGAGFGGNTQSRNVFERSVHILDPERDMAKDVAGIKCRSVQQLHHVVVEVEAQDAELRRLDAQLPQRMPAQAAAVDTQVASRSITSGGVPPSADATNLSTYPLVGSGSILSVTPG
jgi:hypothetical protein